jgi:L-seryl-tRNA(Ser) seleniumtransferase
MGMKTSDLLGSLPTVTELLDKPPVRALVERWNRSIVSGGVRSFLDELRSDLQRRAIDAGLPSLRELAERAAKYVVEMQQPALRPAINATGRLLDSSWIGNPLADQALERVVALGRGFIPSAANCTDVAAALARLTGAEAATVVHSYAGAISLALSALAAEKEVVIGRPETGEVDPGCHILALARAADVQVKEVGCANRVSIADYEAAVSAHTAAIVRHTADGYRLAGDAAAADNEELVALARDREVPLICAVGSAPLVGGLPAIGDTIPSAAAAVAAGAHAVIIRGDGLVGGPPCGIIVGQSEVVRRVEGQALFQAWRLSALSSAALLATLEIYDDRSTLAEKLPLLQLLTVSVDNLRLRAERLAPQLGHANGVSSAEPISVQSSLGLARYSHLTWHSYGIALTAADGDVRTLDKRLRAAPVPVVGTAEGPRLVLDLRGVFPRQDQQIVEILAGSGPAWQPLSTTDSIVTVEP